MTLKKLRQILKSLGDDTRLRIVNLLSEEELTVTEICSALKINQPAVSKHLVRLRLLKIVNDRREGNCIYYSPASDVELGKIINFLLSEFNNMEVFKKDRESLHKYRKK